MKKYLFFIVSAAVLLLTSCNGERYEKYQIDYLNLFDTHTRFTAYARNQAEFDHYVNILYSEMSRLNEYFDIYHEYEGLNNLMTVNSQAGIAPVVVNDEIISLLTLCVQACSETNGAVNAALGPVLSVWHTYREEGLLNPEFAELPPFLLLQDAMKNTDIKQLVIDNINKTVFLEQQGMFLDVGAIAKGFAAQLVVDKLKAQGLVSCVLDIGGNIVTVGKPMDNTRNHWNIGIQNPDDEGVLDVENVNDMAIVTSGDYQRYYVVDSVRYSHIIDPATLMPAGLYRSVTVLHENAGIADMLSTALFILPYEKGCELADSYKAAVIWVMGDLSVLCNERYDAYSKQQITPP